MAARLALLLRFWSARVDALELHLIRLDQSVDRATLDANEKQGKEGKVTNLERYDPGPARGAQVQKDDEKMWTLILVRELRHPPEKVWQALTDPAHLREWAPFEVDGGLGTIGTVNLTWAGNPKSIETKVTRADAPKMLEYGDMRWELKAFAGGTRLTLWIKIDRRFVAWGAAGWHISFDVLDRFLAGDPIGRIAGADAMKFEGWQRLVGEYAKQFGSETPKWPPKSAQKS